ncbi:glycosyltransferase family 2 protein [Sulfurimonas sp. C5]|uniref:glycosyltransferase family 2 protein n=1 Tax=Sulfurimonas sp. C5 TaxID=3036947 RepID=UPI002457CA67|nr:glycosyltransferase family 2 protein [Sulfurimonas sp. C5]MDH4945500.1 glycosyltransferase family 2 protein [Sulfurimonas sp. C5]
MSQPLISIAMCTYNGEKYLQEQLDSILDQTYKNLEIIISDDCSTDSTVQIIENYQNIDPRIKLYKNEKNLGFLKNFEKTIALCSGDFIALADQDDIWKQNKLEKFYNELDDNVLIYSDALIMDKDSKETGTQLVRPKSNLCKGRCNKAFFLNNFVSGNTMMFKQELVKYILPIPEQMSYHDIWIGYVASTYGHITYTEEPMTYYRKYEGQVTHQGDIIPTNIFQRLRYKKNLRMKVANIRAKDCESFLSLEILKDEDTIKTLELLLEHYKNFNKIYFNYKLYKILHRYTEELFCSIRESKRSRRAFRTAVGMKLKTLSFFIL